VPAVLGADLLARRPDVVAARERAQAASSQVQEARAQFYPDINLTAFVGLNAIGLDHLVDLHSRQYGVGPAIHLPVFEGGQLRANLKGRSADYNAAVQAYNQQVLDAVREAADASASAASLGRQRAQQQQALASAESAYDIAQQRYRQGLTSYLVVLNTETQVLAQRRAAVDLQFRTLDVQAQLMKSLGGGWIAPGAASATSAATVTTTPNTTTLANAS
jgi:NodT family efflux transporter outer membrane factor (OMF) lipoprotein